jgi:hypothetical protein
VKKKVKLENEAILSKIVFGMILGEPYEKEFQKFLQIPILITHH